MKRHARWISFAVIAAGSVALHGCSSSSEGAAPPATPPGVDCTAEHGEKCAEKVPGGEIGKGDGTPESVSFVEMYKASAKAELVDLAFNPSVANELWVIGYADSSVHVGNDVHGEAPTWKRYVDPAAVHFMHKPPAIAMGASPFFGTCGDGDNSAAEREPNLFMGPAMFTTDRNIFAKRITGLGSHYDMLHNTPFCRGIAHETANIYWVFNSFDGSIDKYNFNQDHGPGMDDHADGEIYRYAVGDVKGVEGVSSHLVFDATDGYVYVSDTGNQRIVKLDPASGKKGESLVRQNEPLQDQGFMEGSTVEEVVPPGVLEQPSGIEVRNDHLYVTDTATGTFHVFDKTGKAVRKLETGLPAGALSGFTFDANGKIWFTDRSTGRVLRIDPL